MTPCVATMVRVYWECVRVKLLLEHFVKYHRKNVALNVVMAMVYVFLAVVNVILLMGDVLVANALPICMLNWV